MTSGGRLTIAAIGVTAFAFCDLVHEVAGHGLAVLLVPGAQTISLSSVALQTTARAGSSAAKLAQAVEGALVSSLEIPGLVILPYAVGSTLLVAAAALNAVIGHGISLYVSYFDPTLLEAYDEVLV